MSGDDVVRKGRIVGIDYGTVRIGVAITDREQTIASPWDNYRRRDADADAEYFRILAQAEDIQQFVVGLPVHLSGNESQKSLEAREFGVWLQKTTGVEVVFFDERFTSREADMLLAAGQLSRKQRKIRRDKLAAQIMLTAYLEYGHAAGEPRSLDD